MGQVRIVGGHWRSRRIAFAALPGLRPTPDAVRETLFNWLGQDLTGLACLDLFAGSGALGFEAASRGAATVTLVERHPRAVAALQSAARELDAGMIEVVRADALDFLAAVPRRYDLVFIDPPYRAGWLERIAAPLAAACGAGARLYVEAEAALDRLGPWRAVRAKRAGQVHYHLMERDEQ